MDRITNPELPAGEDPRVFIEGDTTKPATPLSIGWLNALQAELINLIEASGQTPNPDDHEQLLKALQGFSAPVRVDVFEKSGTWLKPDGAKSVHILLIGGGGGGGAGEVKAAGTKAIGGHGGGGAAVFMATVPASNVPDSVAVLVGSAGTGGTSPGGMSSASEGKKTQFGDLFFAAGGSLLALPNVNCGMFPGANPLVGNNSSGWPNQRQKDITGGGLSMGMPSGSPGTGILSNNTAPLVRGYKYQSLMLGNNDQQGTSTGLDGAPAKAYLDGWSGAGGHAWVDRDGEHGGHGGKYGCGGGGGGAARTGFIPGDGGNGGPGVAVVISYF